MNDNSTLEGSQIMKLLKALQMNNTIDNTKYINFVRKVKKMSDYLVEYQESEKTLMQYLAKLKEENNKVITEYANLQGHQRDQNEVINQSAEELRKAKVELAEYENTRIANKIYEIDQKKENIEELKQKIQDSEEEQLKKLNAEIEKYQESCRQFQKKIEDEENEIKKIQNHIKDTMRIKETVEQNNILKVNQIEEQKDEISRKKNGIQNEMKYIEQNEQALNQLKQDKEAQENLKVSREQTLKECEEIIQKITVNKENAITSKENLEKERNNKRKENDHLKTLTREKDANNSKLLDYRNKKKDEKDKKQKELKNAKDAKETERKAADERKKTTTDKENIKIRLKNEAEEEENNLKQCKIKLEKIEKEIQHLKDNISDVTEEINFKERKEKNKQQLIAIEKTSKKEFDEQANYLESSKNKLLEKVEELKSNIEEMKNIRQTMSRSVAAREEKTRAINDEIQIKELIFLDMTKKHEELKNKYQHYHLKYESVLNERNKNVVKIQNANQKKSETREKTKIITTEMDILQAELNETNNQLAEKKKDLDKMKQKQDALKKEINEFQFEYKKHEEEIKRLTNENEKLHSILNSIESDMVNIRADYEVSCESRNLTGIQLIDRNDELCVFYEKIQHLEGEINILYKNILQKEQKIKRLQVDNAEVERFIEVNRRKIPLIPTMSNQIKELDNELKLLNKALEELVKHIESPENDLKRELPGEDPEIDYLKMKYQQLTEMLNEKKENLLEKELINEEINDIAEKLRKKALEDRSKNLDISEKMNYYEIQFNEITRKNIAVTSELAMFKAILFNLENTKREKVIIFYLKKNYYFLGKLLRKST
jgi:chromosome segregation ATPase